MLLAGAFSGSDVSAFAVLISGPENGTTFCKHRRVTWSWVGVYSGVARTHQPKQHTMDFGPFMGEASLAAYSARGFWNQALRQRTAFLFSLKLLLLRLQLASCRAHSQVPKRLCDACRVPTWQQPWCSNCAKIFLLFTKMNAKSGPVLGARFRTPKLDPRFAFLLRFQLGLGIWT